MPRCRPAFRTLPAALAGLVLLAVLLAGACTPKGAGKLDAPAAQAQWASFMAAGGAPAKAFTLSASLNLPAPQKSTRVLLKFWGNLDRPMRLDITASVGSTFAMWREDSLGWLALYPMANQAFTHPDTRKGLNKLGMPFPFGMKELAGVITGNFAALLPSTYQRLISEGIIVKDGYLDWRDPGKAWKVAPGRVEDFNRLIIEGPSNRYIPQGH